MGTLVVEVSNLKELDQVVLELKDQLVTVRGIHRDKSPATTGGNQGEKSHVIHLERGELSNAQKQFNERFHREKGASSFTNHYSQYSRWSRMEFLRFSGEDLRSWLFRIEQFFSMDNIPMEEMIGIASLQFDGEVVQ
ncbi:hypothetical protein KY289_017316 [Solanum tuberosum]|nr:hypothetical protein KY289_017316 [Solanum tuberosum]